VLRQQNSVSVSEKLDTKRGEGAGRTNRPAHAGQDKHGLR